MLANITASQYLLVRMSQLQVEGKITEAHASLAKAFTTTQYCETVAWRSSLLLRGQVPNAKPNPGQGRCRPQGLPVVGYVAAALHFVLLPAARRKLPLQSVKCPAWCVPKRSSLDSRRRFTFIHSVEHPGITRNAQRAKAQNSVMTATSSSSPWHDHSRKRNCSF